MLFQIIFHHDENKILVENPDCNGIFCMVECKGLKYPQNISYLQSFNAEICFGSTLQNQSKELFDVLFFFSNEVPYCFARGFLLNSHARK